MPKFAFIYFMKNLPDKIPEIVPLHKKYWFDAHLPDYKGGPFSDRTGGLIVFNTSDMKSAESIVNKDPFVLNDLLQKRWLKEWAVE